MLYFILIAIMTLLLGCSAIQYSNNTTLKQHNFLYVNNVITIGILFAFVIFAFLQKDVGDLIGYKNSYKMFANLSWDYLLPALEKRKDPGYHLTTFLVAKLGIDYRMWRTLVAGIFSLGLYNVISRHSVNPFLSLMVTISLGLYTFTFTGLRQSLAFSMLLFSYSFLKEKKFWKFALIVLIAACFHSTAIVFLAAYPIYYLKERNRSIVILFTIGAFLMLNARYVMQLYINFTGNESYSSYLERDTTLSISGIVIYGIILAFSLFFGYKKGLSNGRLCHLLTVSFLFRILSAAVFAEMFRLSMYFSLFDSILLAEICSSNDKITQNSKIKTILVSFSLLLYFIISPAGNISLFEFR